jgi:hypothetical protein
VKSIDKQVTRWAARGFTKVLLYGRWYALEKGQHYRVKYNRAAPGKSELVRVLYLSPPVA